MRHTNQQCYLTFFLGFSSTAGSYPRATTPASSKTASPTSANQGPVLGFEAVSVPSDMQCQAENSMKNSHTCLGWLSLRGGHQPLQTSPSLPTYIQSDVQSRRVAPPSRFLTLSFVCIRPRRLVLMIFSDILAQDVCQDSGAWRCRGLFIIEMWILRQSVGNPTVPSFSSPLLLRFQVSSRRR